MVKKSFSRAKRNGGLTAVHSLKRERARARRRVPFGEEASFERSTGAWSLD